MKNFKIIGLSFAMLFSASTFAQESEIVMTKDELKSFLETVAQARREQIKTQREKSDKAYLYQLRAKYNQGGMPYNTSDVQQQIYRLNDRIDYLTEALILANGKNSDKSTIILPGSNGTGQATYTPIPNVDSKDDLAREKAIWKLEQELAALKEQQAVDKANDVKDLEQKYASLEERIKNANTAEERRSALEELLAKFKNFKKQVFFANNSDQLSSEDFQYINDVSEVLKKYPDLSVVLEGWASPKGKADYNKQLSMRRAETVKNALVNKGISSERVVSSFKGEDHSTSEAMARRVDMSVILK